MSQASIFRWENSMCFSDEEDRRAALASAWSHWLTQQLEPNSADRPPPEVACFYSKSLAEEKTTVDAYLARLVTYTDATFSEITCACVYLRRWRERATDEVEETNAMGRTQSFVRGGMLTLRSCYRLCLCALVLAFKYLRDHTYSLRHYAKVGGISLSDLRDLELRFLSHLEFEAHISRTHFDVLRDQVFPAITSSSSEKALTTALPSEVCTIPPTLPQSPPDDSDSFLHVSECRRHHKA